MADSPSSSSSDDNFEDATSTQPSAPTNPSSYRLHVTAGPSYSPSTHHPVLINTSTPQTITTPHMTLTYAIRIKHFTGTPPSPETSPYFTHPLHTSDQYSISLSFVPHSDIPGTDLVFGNDFDRPIRDRLPPGFGQAFRFVKWWIDPGLEGDVYADKPYLYGAALSSWNTFHIGDKVADDKDIKEVPDTSSFPDRVVEEGASDPSGEEVREEQSIPSDAAGRKKFFLTETNREAFVFEKGRCYSADFFNPYLDFNDFSLKLPGFTLNVVKYVDRKTHELRYVLKNKRTEELYACWMFTLLWGEEAERVVEEEKGLVAAEGEGGRGKVEGGKEKTMAEADDIPEDDDDID